MTFTRKKFTALMFSFQFLFFSCSLAFATEKSSISDFVKTATTPSHEGMTLLQILQAGGIVMIVLGILSMIMLSIVLFLFLKLNPKRMIPETFTENLIKDLANHRYENALTLCEENDSFISSIVSPGLNQDLTSQQQAEAIASEARREVSTLWTQLNYLSEISQVAPMLGLLGTVLGMIQAFNTIAFDAAGVKPILLAGGVSKAMVTTAAGLTIAIVTIIFYSLLRVKVQKITDLVEAAVSRITDTVTKNNR